jgi:hypothetical protein
MYILCFLSFHLRCLFTASLRFWMAEAKLPGNALSFDFLDAFLFDFLAMILEAA